MPRIEKTALVAAWRDRSTLPSTSMAERTARAFGSTTRGTSLGIGAGTSAKALEGALERRGGAAFVLSAVSNLPGTTPALKLTVAEEAGLAVAGVVLAAGAAFALWRWHRSRTQRPGGPGKEPVDRA